MNLSACLSFSLSVSRCGACRRRGWHAAPPPLCRPVLTAFSPSCCSPLGKLGSKGPWGDGPVPTPANSELWGAPQNKPRGPPPGLSSKNPNGGGNGGGAAGGAGQGGGTGSSGSSTSSNGWGRGGGGGSGSGGASSWGIQGAGATATPGAGTAGTGTTGTAGWGSTWLLLKNLTPQVRHCQVQLQARCCEVEFCDRKDCL